MAVWFPRSGLSAEKALVVALEVAVIGVSMSVAGMISSLVSLQTSCRKMTMLMNTIT